MYIHAYKKIHSLRVLEKVLGLLGIIFITSIFCVLYLHFLVDIFRLAKVLSTEVNIIATKFCQCLNKLDVSILLLKTYHLDTYSIQDSCNKITQYNGYIVGTQTIVPPWHMNSNEKCTYINFILKS